MDLTLNNLKRLICHKPNRTTKNLIVLILLKHSEKIAVW